MRYRPLGCTGIEVSELAFGAGPVPELLTGSDEARQADVVRHALQSGINWFDTAATYGDGQSERALGRALKQLEDAGPGAATRPYHVATKVRLMPSDLADIGGAVERSFYGSLKRLQLERVTLLQIHNSITASRGDQPTSLTSADVLGRDGLLPHLTRLRDQGLVDHLGITGLGEAQHLEALIESGAFATMQVPLNLFNPSARVDMPATFAETDYGNTITRCLSAGMGVFAIRVLAGGAMLRRSPSQHTLRTRFFPLDLYRRDCLRAEALAAELSIPVQEAALRFCGHDDGIASSIVGFSSRAHIDEAVAALAAGPLSDEQLAVIERAWRT